MAYRSKQFSLVIVLILVIFKFQSTKGNEENCEECTTKINATIDLMRDQIRSRDPIYLDTPAPCNNCNFSGIITIGTNGEVCSHQVKQGDVTCYDHTLKLIFSKIKVTCECTLPTNPMDVAKLIAEQAQDPMKGVKCVEEGQTPIDPTKLGDEMSDVPSMDPMTILSLKECQPKTFPIPKMSLGAKPKPVPPTVTGTIVTTYVNFKMTIVLRACENSEDVKTQEIKLDKSCTKDVTFECKPRVGEEDFFKDSCMCLAKTEFMTKISKSCMSMLFPCYGDSKISENADIAKELVCNELLK